MLNNLDCILYDYVYYKFFILAKVATTFFFLLLHICVPLLGDRTLDVSFRRHQKASSDDKGPWHRIMYYKRITGLGDAWKNSVN